MCWGLFMLMLMLMPRARTHIPTLTLNTYLRKLESWDQYGGMCMYARASTYTNQHRPVSPNPKLSVYRSMWCFLVMVRARNTNHRTLTCT